jgi:hypothetical protein
MQTFQVGQSYSCRSPGDFNCVWTFKVISRTEKTVKLQDSAGKIKTRRISIYENCKSCSPLGVYSLSPLLTAR